MFKKIKKTVKKAAKDVKNGVTKFAAKFKTDDYLARKCYEIIGGWEGNTGLGFKKKKRVKVESEDDGTELDVKEERWKMYVKTPHGKLKLKAKHQNDQLKLKGKYKEIDRKNKVYLNIDEFTDIESDGEIELKNKDRLKEILKAAFA